MPEIFFTSDESYDNYTRDIQESTFGGELDDWGYDWTPAEVNSFDFKVVFDVNNFPEIGGALAVEDVTCEIFYTLPFGDQAPDALQTLIKSSPMATCCAGAGPSGTRLVVAGAGGLVKTSDDMGATWTERETGVASLLRGIVWGNGEFVAVGDNGTIVTSPDGTTWTKEDGDAADSLRAVAFDKENRSFITVGRELRARSVTRSWSIGKARNVTGEPI